MTGTERLEALVKSSKGVITAKLANAHDIHREYLRDFARQVNWKGLLTVSILRRMCGKIRC